ncbi:MAG: MFS transporter [Acidobacteriota bacterium]|nr:MFS transporter [Acidobacteriota bacterium]
MTKEAGNGEARITRYNNFLLLVAGLGGLLYGVDVGIIGGALPYLEATSRLTPGQLSVIVAAVLLGSVFSTLFAGALADWLGRKPLMLISGLAFIVSIPVIALSHGYAPLFFGRLLQGMSGGLIGVVVPLYLAECMTAARRGRGTGIFQWMLTLGIVAAAVVGIYYSYRVEVVARYASDAGLFAFKDQAWRRIFWVSLPPGILFSLGSLFVQESPRWLYRRGRSEAALAALLSSRTPAQAALELQEMAQAAGDAPGAPGGVARDSLLQRKYVIPFLLACVILFCNTATGVNSIIGYNTGILLQSGLNDLWAHWGYVLFTVVNFAMTLVGISLVDRKGRRFLLTLGTSGVIASLLFVGAMFHATESQAINVSAALQAEAAGRDTLRLPFDQAEAARLLAASGSTLNPSHATLGVIYAYGDFIATTSYARSDDVAAPLVMSREAAVPANRVEAFFRNPFADLAKAQHAPLRILQARLGEVPSATHGWLVALGLYGFMAFFAMGPGSCVWLALSELMPTRIRSNGMSIALVINQMVSTTLAGIFLPFVGRYGYAAIFFLFAGFTVVYFLTAVFALPETKGKTLEEIEAHFAGSGSKG